MTEYDINKFVGVDAIQDNAADFTDALMAMADYVEGAFENVIRKACIDLYRRIAERTPVDTGRAKASWGISNTSNHEEPKEGEFSHNEVAAFINEQVQEFSVEIIEDQVIIYNNLEYIEELENGTSQQAPYGMVSLSLAEFENFFNEQLVGLKGLDPI